jgi:hypothetical protein
MLSGNGAIADARSRQTAVLWAAAEPLAFGCRHFEPFAEVEPRHNSGKEDLLDLGRAAVTPPCSISTSSLACGDTAFAARGRRDSGNGVRLRAQRERERGGAPLGDDGIWTNGACQDPG